MGDPITLGVALETASLSIEAFHQFGKIFKFRDEYRVNKFLNTCYYLYLQGGKDSEEVRKTFIEIVEHDPEILTGRIADFINQVLYSSSDLCSICYSFLYNRHICQGKDIFGVSEQTFEKLATTMIQGMDDRDIRFYIALYEFTNNHQVFRMPHDSLILYAMNDPEIYTFLSENPDLRMSHEGFLVLCNDLIRRRILIPNLGGRYDTASIGFGIGLYSKDFYDLFKDANTRLVGD